MKMFRVSLAAILGAVALATNETAAPTESPVDVAESARDSALDHANQTLHGVMRTAHESRGLGDDEDLVDQEVATIESAVPNTTEHYLRQRLRTMDERQHARKHDVRVQVEAAKEAADQYKDAARALEAARRSAGLSERVYEGGYQDDEQLSEGWHDQAEDYGDAAENHIEGFFHAVEDKLEQHVDREEHEQEDEDDDGDNNRGNHEHGQQDDGNNRGNQEDDDRSDAAPAPAPAPASDDQQDDANLALNLRAQNPRNPQGFLLTFTCIGFLASMALAVQMQSRRTRSQASEPLLLVHD